VPETRTIVDLLPELTRMRTKLALVIDEHGGLAGCLTIEDIVEEIVGEIVDEYDPVPPEEIVRRSDDPPTYDVGGGVSVRHVNRTLDLHLDEDLADTIGGYVLALLGHIPVAGEVQDDARGVRFEIREVRRRRIRSVRITVPVSEGGER
jgi:CBS domain containing-hemolysin-like protein